MLIHLPVTPFTQKCLIHEFSSEPIALSHRHPFLPFLTCARVDSDSEMLSYLKLTEKVLVDVPRDVFDSLSLSKNSVGLFLHNVHKRELCAFVEAKVTEGSGAMDAIYRFCAAREIDIDIDISFDALHKMWQRFYFSKKNKPKIATLPASHVPQMLRFLADNTQPERRYTDKELDNICLKYFQTYPSVSRDNRRREKSCIKKQVRIYIYRTIGRQSVNLVAGKFKTDRTVVYKAVKKCETLLASKPPQNIADDERPRQAQNNN